MPILDNHIRNRHRIFVPWIKQWTNSTAKVVECPPFRCGRVFRYQCRSLCSDGIVTIVWKDGNYTVDISMNEMVDIWWNTQISTIGIREPTIAPQELKPCWTSVFHPETLATRKRWRNMFMKLSMGLDLYWSKSLSWAWSRTVGWNGSPFILPFPQGFRNVTGENIGTYIFNVYGWNILPICLSLPDRVLKIGMQTNYQTKFSLAKALRSISVFQCQLIAKV